MFCVCVWVCMRNCFYLSLSFVSIWFCRISPFSAFSWKWCVLIFLLTSYFGISLSYLTQFYVSSLSVVVTYWIHFFFLVFNYMPCDSVSIFLVINYFSPQNKNKYVSLLQYIFLCFSKDDGTYRLRVFPIVYTNLKPLFPSFWEKRKN